MPANVSVANLVDPRESRIVLEAQYLPDSEKRAFAHQLLVEMGATNITERGDELNHSCVLPFGLHPHGDRSASASFNWRKQVVNCLAGETMVKTFDGPRRIDDLASDGRAVLLDGNGQWIDCEVRSFGTQELMKITLRRNKTEKVVFATSGHRWFRKGRGTYADGSRDNVIEVTTKDLSKGHRLISRMPDKRASRYSPSPFGVARGFIYGDGSSHVGGSVAHFCGEKDQALQEFFPDGYSRTANGSIVSGLPRSWKAELPALDEGSGFLFGWLAGYFAADGCVDTNGQCILASARREDLEYVKILGDRLGIGTYEISSQMRRGYGDADTELFFVRFVSSTLPDSFFVINHHRERREKLRHSYDRLGWTVENVEATDRVEEVYCAVVPTTHSFVLDGYLTSGNCFVCGGGGVLWFIAVCKGTTSTDAEKWVKREFKLDFSSPDDFMRVINGILTEQKDRPPAMPRYADAILEPWKAIHPYMTEIRQVPAETIMHFEVGWDPTDNRIVIPHRWRGQLVGWQKRRLVEGLDKRGNPIPKYQNSPDFPKDRTVYNHDPSISRIVVVESPMSVLRHWHHASNMVATFGAEMTEQQLGILARHGHVTLWFDPDPAGWNSTKLMVEYLAPRTDVAVVVSPFMADPADMSDGLVDQLIADAVIWPLWSPPDPKTIVALEE